MALEGRSNHPTCLLKGRDEVLDEQQFQSVGGVPVRTPINAVLILMFARGSGLAQQPPLTIDQAVQQALDQYPAIRSSLEQVSAAA